MSGDKKNWKVSLKVLGFSSRRSREDLNLIMTSVQSPPVSHLHILKGFSLITYAKDGNNECKFVDRFGIGVTSL